MSMTRRFRVVALVTFVLLGLLVGTAGSVAADSQYSCSDNSCTFSVPDSYSQASNDPSQIIFQDSASGGTFSVAAQDGSQYASLDDAVKSLMGQASKSDGYQADPARVQSLIVGGNPAQSFAYLSNNSSGTSVEQAVISSIYHNRLYLLIFSTTPANEAAFLAGAQGVFNSWQFT